MLRLGSDRSKNLGLAALVAAVGALFVYLVQGQAPSRDLQAARWLGYLLLLVGGSALVLDERIELEIDVERGVVRQLRRTLFQTLRRSVPSTDVLEVAVTHTGTSSDGLQFYFIALALKDGTRLATGQMFSDGAAAQREARRIAAALGIEAGDAAHVEARSVNATDFAVALVLGILGYLLYYRARIGPWCPAMWFGTLPPVMILLGTWSAYLGLRWLRR